MHSRTHCKSHYTPSFASASRAPEERSAGDSPHQESTLEQRPGDTSTAAVGAAEAAGIRGSHAESAGADSIK